jgi:hypothetical protein
MQRLKSILYFSAALIFMVSCKNTEADLLCYEVDMEGVEANIFYESGTVEVTFPENVRSARDLNTIYCISEGASAYVNHVKQKDGIGINNYEEPFEFTIISQDKLSSSTWNICSQNNDFTKKWGLGGFLKSECSNDRTYDWYIDQSRTGSHSDYNCAPSCVVMASLWQDPDCSFTVEDARDLYHPSGGGWFTTDISRCLDDFDIRHSVISLSDYREKTLKTLRDNLEEGNIILMAIDVHYLEDAEDPEERVNKYYETIKLGTGHCIVLKGFKEVDGQVFFEVYDPIGYDYIYDDGSFKGENRYYKSDDIYTAAFASWNYAILVLGRGNTIQSEKSVSLEKIPNILIL